MTPFMPTWIELLSLANIVFYSFLIIANKWYDLRVTIIRVNDYFLWLKAKNET